MGINIDKLAEIEQNIAARGGKVLFEDAEWLVEQVSRLRAVISAQATEIYYLRSAAEEAEDRAVQIRTCRSGCCS